MTYFTSNTYILKRKILTFTNKISKHLSKPKCKFTADITYGILASGSCLLTDVADQLHEDSKKINIVDRLSRHLDKKVLLLKLLLNLLSSANQEMGSGRTSHLH